MVLGGSPCAVRTGRLREGGSDPGESVASISGVVAVGRACSALLRILGVLRRCFVWFGLFIRCVSFPQEQLGVGGGGRCVLVRLRQRARNTQTGRPMNQVVSVAALETLLSVAARSTAARMSAVR